MTTEVEDDDNDSVPQRRLTDEEFATAKELYELGKASIMELAKEFSISRQALSRKFKDKGIVKGSRAHELSQAGSADVKATIERFAEKRAEMIEETRMTGYNALKQARMIGQKIVVDQIRASKTLGEVDEDLKAVARFSKMLTDNITTALQILQADDHIDEADLPILTIEDLTDMDILNHHISTGALDANATLKDINSEIQE